MIVKSLLAATVLATASLYASPANAQQIVVVGEPQPAIETVRWRRYDRAYYAPYGYRPFVRPYYSYSYRYYTPRYAYRPYWNGYYYSGPRVYYR